MWHGKYTALVIALDRYRRIQNFEYYEMVWRSIRNLFSELLFVKQDSTQMYLQ